MEWKARCRFRGNGLKLTVNLISGTTLSDGHHGVIDAPYGEIALEHPDPYSGWVRDHSGHTPETRIRIS